MPPVLGRVQGHVQDDAVQHVPVQVRPGRTALPARADSEAWKLWQEVAHCFSLCSRSR